VALNLWKLGTLPTSYNPLPIGFTNASKLSNMNLGDFIIRLQAKSVSNAKLRFQLSNGGNFLRDYQLSNTFTFIEVSFTNPSLQNFYLNDLNSNGDIIIDSIELIQKPLPKLTVNGVDGFTSGKWSLNSNATVIDDETLQINFNGTAMNTTLLVNILPNSTYTLRFDGDGKTWVDTLDASQARINNKVGNLLAGTFTMSTESNAKYLSITFFGNVNGQPPGIFTYKRPMLNLGSTPAPYSRKTGDKMVLPVAKKNLISQLFTDSAWVKPANATVIDGYNVTINATVAWESVSLTFPVISGKTYTFSAEGFGKIAINKANSASSANDVSNIVLNNNRGSITFTADSSYSGTILVRLASTGSGLFNFSNPQLEEGTSATAYTPYAVQVNDLAKRYVPKKNFVSNAQGDWEIGSGDPNSNGDTTRIRMKNRFDVKVGNSYMISWNSTLYDVYLFESTGGAPLGWYMTSPVTFSAVSPQYRAVLRRKDLGQIAVSEINNVNLQIELGSTATSYEPYALTLPKARTGLTFNGVTDYVSLPYLTMDSIEIECLIDSTQPDTTPVIFHNSGGFGRVGGVNGGIISSITANGVNYVTNQIMFSNQRVKIVYKFSSSFTSTTNIFSSLSATQHVKGILYKVTCYLGGQVVAQYDFENASNIVGSNVLQNAQNLIPSFEDTRWRFDLNYYSVMGKNALTSKVPSAFAQSSIVLDVKGGQSYLMTISYLTKNARYLWETYDVNGNVVNSLAVALQDSTLSRVVSFGQNVTSVKIMFDNVVSGSFDFIKPQLYALSGTEGTIYGTPTSARKQSRRTQYAKR
jgi:hypothetical protein